MHILEQLGVALGLATLAGVNLYLTVFLAGLAVRFDLLHLAEKHEALAVLGHPLVLVVAGILFFMEFLADKVPWVDSLWDSVHTFIRPVGAVLLGLQALGEMPVYLQVIAALVAGGAALTTHTAKAGTRLAVNHSPEPVSNISLSVAEDAGVAGGVFLTLLHPVVALGVFATLLVILWIILPRLWRMGKTSLWLMWNKLKMPGRTVPIAEPVELRPFMDDTQRDLLRLYANVEESDVQATVRCVSARSKGIKGLLSNLKGTLALVRRSDHVFFCANKGFRVRLFRVPLSGATVRVDSRFLSENLIVEHPTAKAVFRFHRGQGDIAQSVCLHLTALMKEASQPVTPISVRTPEEAKPQLSPTPSAAEAPSMSAAAGLEPEPTAAKDEVTPMPAVAMVEIKKDAEEESLEEKPQARPNPLPAAG